MKRILVTAGSLAVAAITTVAVTATPAHAGGTRDVVLATGHVDVIGVAYEDGELDLHVHDEENDAEYQPGEVTLQALPAAETTVPADPAFGFLGAPGDPVWILPQLENPDLLFAGLATEEIEAGDLAGDQVQVTLAVIGPGDVAVYIEDELGLPSEILFDTDDGSRDMFTLTAGGHVHANWAFSEPGNYHWVVAATARDAATNAFVADAGIYHFQVLD
jgi:surface-anchored protein